MIVQIGEVVLQDGLIRRQGSTIRGYFRSLDPDQQLKLIRDMRAQGHSERGIARATAMDLESIRALLA
jgi:hypothetical protein